MAATDLLVIAAPLIYIQCDKTLRAWRRSLSMEALTRYLADNPVIAGLIVLSAAIVFYFLIKKILKYALISLAVFILLMGYSYYKAPEEFPDRVKSNISELRERSGDVIEKGKGVLEKRQGVTDTVERMFEKGRELFAGSDGE